MFLRGVVRPGAAKLFAYSLWLGIEELFMEIMDGYRVV
ncbi:hypothetical protein DB29_02230 [Shouchella clausii]|jgi:hypothetical protein|nr:hypothetical protein DB29_02230 [Shouchella clausii]